MRTKITHWFLLISLFQIIPLNSFSDDFIHHETLTEYEAATAHDNIKGDELPDVPQEQILVVEAPESTQETAELMQLATKLTDYYGRAVTASGFLIPNRISSDSVIQNNGALKHHLKEKSTDDEVSFARYNAAIATFNEALELYKETAASNDPLKDCPAAHGPIF